MSELKQLQMLNGKRAKHTQLLSSPLLLLLMLLLLFDALSALLEDQLKTWQKRGSGWTLEKDIPVIIWWTGRLFSGDKDVKEISCGNAFACYSTADRSLGSVARAFYFYGTDLDPEDLPLPRLPYHEWALLHEESPMNNYMLNHGPMIQQFNHTATFKRESDYPICTHSLPSLEFLLERQPLELERKNELRRRGSAPILYVQSHCDVPSDRDRYVKELMKYISVDSYGNCVNNRDLPNSLHDPVESMMSEEFLQFIAQYKFHLAFENALCPDYMSEKLFRPLHVGSVPIYRGSSRVEDWMPNHRSYIAVDDFQSPQDLAEFVTSLDNNDHEYLKYLQFKVSGIENKFLYDSMMTREWGVNERGKPSMFHGFECHVCKKISERYSREKAHFLDQSVELLPSSHASTSHLVCPQPYTSVGHPSDLQPDDGWKTIDWIEDYWTGFDKALAVQEMISQNETNTKKFFDYWKSVMK